MVKKTILFEGPLTRSGYGQRSKDLILSLIKSEKYDVMIFPTKWGATPPLELNDSDGELIKRHIRQQINIKPDIHIQVTIPSEFRPLGHKSIGITAGTETTSAPKSWIEGCNRMDAVFFSSKHSYDVFSTVEYKTDDSILKLNRPIETLFEGIDISIFNKDNVDKKSNIFKLIDDIPEKFAFLCVGHWLQGNLGADRKDIGMVIHTFLNVFRRKGINNRPALILKSSGAGFSITERDIIIDKINQIQESIRNQFGFKGEFPNIYLLNGDLTDNEMNSLYNHPKVKAMVSFHKGEGWGRPLLEFTTTGKPVIASNWSGPLDFLIKDFCTLLPGQLGQVDRSAANEWIQHESQWFNVNYAYAGQILNDVYQSYERYLEKSRKHTKPTRDNFSIENMQSKLVELLEKYSPVNNTIKLNLPKLKKV